MEKIKQPTNPKHTNGMFELTRILIQIIIGENEVWINQIPSEKTKLAIWPTLCCMHIKVVQSMLSCMHIKVVQPTLCCMHITVVQPTLSCMHIKVVQFIPTNPAHQANAPSTSSFKAALTADLLCQKKIIKNQRMGVGA